MYPSLQFSLRSRIHTIAFLKDYYCVVTSFLNILKALYAIRLKSKFLNVARKVSQHAYPNNPNNLLLLFPSLTHIPTPSAVPHSTKASLQP